MKFASRPPVYFFLALTISLVSNAQSLKPVTSQPVGAAIDRLRAGWFPHSVKDEAMVAREKGDLSDAQIQALEAGSSDDYLSLIHI